MAIISTLRNKLTKWVVGFIAVAIAAFVLNDLFGNGPQSILQGETDDVGEIGGTSIALSEFQGAVQEQENNYILNTGSRPNEQIRNTLEQQAWEMLVLRHAIQPQMEEVGVEVSEEELWDMVQGKNIDDGIRQSFTDSLGQFDRQRIISYLNSINIEQPADPQAAAAWAESRYRWDTYQRNLILSRQRIKFENLINKTYYVTSAEAEKEYHKQSDELEATILYVPFQSINDSTVTPTESQINEYYKKHQQNYQVEQTKNLSYVTFNILPSEKDSLELKESADRLALDFASVEDDSLFAASNTDGLEPFKKYHPGNLPAFLNNQVESLEAGKVLPPALEGDAYKIVKVVAIGSDSVGNAKASHILIKWDAETDEAKAVAKKKAQKILNDIKNGASFADQARTHGQDGTASSGGDLGWFGAGQMVKPFEDAVFGARKTGLIPKLIETQFGYHIIEVTNLKTNQSYTIATIEIKIIPGDESTNMTYHKAQTFLNGIDDIESFNEKASAEQLNVLEANDITSNQRFVGNLGEARRLVTWLYRDGEVGKVSDVIDLGDKYVVAIMTGETEKGNKPLEQIKDEITLAVKKELKSEIIINKLKAILGSVDEIASSYGTSAVVNKAVSLKMTTNALPGVGDDPIAMGRAFSLEAGQRTPPFKGSNGVFIIECHQRTNAPEIAEYYIYKTQLEQSLSSKTGNIGEAIKLGSDIQDQRYKFY